MKSFTLLALFSSLLIHPSAQADTLANDMLGVLQGMRSVYHTRYAPAEWKKKYTGKLGCSVWRGSRSSFFAGRR